MLKQAADNPAAVDKAEAAKLLDRKFLMMRDIFRKNHLAVNVGYLCWAEWARFRPLGWTAPSNETVQRADEEPE